MEEYLRYFTLQEQIMIRLRYGLADDDEHAYTPSEIAHILGVPRKTVVGSIQ